MIVSFIKRNIVLSAIILALAGCSTLSSPSLGTNPHELSELIASDAPRMVLRIPARKQAVTLVAQGSREGVTRWRSADNVQIYTRRGMIIGTRGFGDDVMTVDTGGAIDLIEGQGRGQITRIHRHLDGQDRMQIQSWVCDIAPVGPDTIQIAENLRETLFKTTEACFSPQNTFTNSYWTRNGQIIQSWQYSGSSLQYLHSLFLP